MRIYFARVGRYVKVGSSSNPKRRVRILRSHNIARPADFDYDAPVELLHTTPGTRNDEWLAHQALADFRVVGEWFLAEPALLAWMADRDGSDWPPLERCGGRHVEPEPTSDPALQRVLANTS